MTQGSNKFKLITGRTIKQAQAMHKGKTTPAYLEATAIIEMNASDMEKLGLKAKDRVVLSNDAGKVEVTVNSSDLPEGMIFMPMGESANRLVDALTIGTGMPPFKSMEVEVFRA